jgi:hypothetical protein
MRVHIDRKRLDGNAIAFVVITLAIVLAFAYWKPSRMTGFAGSSSRNWPARWFCGGPYGIAGAHRGGLTRCGERGRAEARPRLCVKYSAAPRWIPSGFHGHFGCGRFHPGALGTWDASLQSLRAGIDIHCIGDNLLNQKLKMADVAVSIERGCASWKPVSFRDAEIRRSGTPKKGPTDLNRIHAVLRWISKFSIYISQFTPVSLGRGAPKIVAF